MVFFTIFLWNATWASDNGVHSAFCTLLMLFQRVEILELQFDAKMWLKWVNLFGIALDLTAPAKNRRNLRILYLNFQIKKLIPLFEIGLQNDPYKAWYFVKCPNSYSVSRSKVCQIIHSWHRNHQNIHGLFFNESFDSVKHIYFFESRSKEFYKWRCWLNSPYFWSSKKIE